MEKSEGRTPMAARIWLWILALVLLAAGLFFVIGGAKLITLSGSWYFVVAGVALLASAVQIARGRVSGGMPTPVSWTSKRRRQLSVPSSST